MVRSVLPPSENDDFGIGGSGNNQGVGQVPLLVQGGHNDAEVGFCGRFAEPFPVEIVGIVQIVERVQQAGLHAFAPGQVQRVFQYRFDTPGNALENIFQTGHAYQPVAAVFGGADYQIVAPQPLEGRFQVRRGESGDVRSHQHHDGGRPGPKADRRD